MFTSIDKAIVATIMPILWLVNQFWGLGWYGHVSEETVGIAAAVLTPILVWAIPNKQPAQTLTPLNR